MGRNGRQSGALILALACAGGCTREAPSGKERISKVQLNQRGAAPEQVKPSPEAPVLKEERAPPTDAVDISPLLATAPEVPPPLPAVDVPAASLQIPEPLWETKESVRVSHAARGRLLVAEVKFAPKVDTTIREITPKAASPLVEGLARVDAIDLAKDGACFVEFPHDAKDGIQLKTIPGAGAPVTSLLARFDGGHHVVNCDGDPFWIAPVEQQGRLGGLGWLDPSTKKKAKVNPELGPAFALTAYEGRVFFMAHTRGGPDVIYSMKTDTTDLRAHAKMGRGVIGLAVGDGFIYWSHLMADGRSTDVGRVPIDGSAPPTQLVTVRNYVFQSLALSADGLVAATSPAELPGRVVRISTDKPGTIDSWPEVPRVWHVMGDKDGVFLDQEREKDGAKMRSFARLK